MAGEKERRDYYVSFVNDLLRNSRGKPSKNVPAIVKGCNEIIVTERKRET